MESLLKYFQKTKSISRREFIDMITEGVINLNGNIVTDSNTVVKNGDKLEINLPDGNTYTEIIKIHRFKPVIVAFNKPKGYTVSKEDKHNKTIFELLPPKWLEDFYYIGRLDKDSHGLLLLTNDPKIVDEYENPKNKIFKIYEVKIDKYLKTNHIKLLKKGILVNENGELCKDTDDHNQNIGLEKLAFYDIHEVKTKEQGFVLRILLTEGKKRHIRRALNSLGYKIFDLKRIKVGKYELGDIKPGKYRIFPVKPQKTKKKDSKKNLNGKRK